VQILIQLGPEITSDLDTVRSLLLRFGISDQNPPRDDQVHEIMTTLARLASEGTVMCDVPSLVRALNSFVCTNDSTPGASVHHFVESEPQLGEGYQVI
jgi:CCR4-NOT transcription complex subunit 1